MNAQAHPAALRETGPADGRVRLILAHGAGAPMDSPFMERMSALLAERDVAVTRFEFDYMAARRVGAKRRPPPKAELLCDAFRSVVRQVAERNPAECVLIGGKSMGGRVASLVADELYGMGQIAGLVCLGYPFHPPAKPTEWRTAHLERLICPALIVQGERDPFGSYAEVKDLPLSRVVRTHWLRDGDHDFGPRGNAGVTRRQNLEAAADAVVGFIRETAS